MVNRIKQNRMRLFKIGLQSIIAIVAMALCLACNDDKPGKETPTPDDKVEGAFHFTEAVASQRALSVNITPEDPEMEYIVLLAQKKHFIINDIDSRKKLLDDDLYYIKGLAQQYNMSIRDFLSGMNWLCKGEKMGYGATGLYPDTEYVVYCYGVEFTEEGFEATTEVCYDVIKTAGPVAKEATFDITCTVDGNQVDISINPKGYEGLYYYYLVPETSREYVAEGETLNDTQIEMFSNITFDRFNQWLNIDGTPIGEFCLQGHTIIPERVEPNANYMVVAFAVSDDTTPLLCSTPAVKHFTSGDFAKSSLKLDIEVTNITPYEATLNVRPSNNQDTYTCIFIAASQMPLVDNDYQLMKALVEVSSHPNLLAPSRTSTSVHLCPIRSMWCWHSALMARCPRQTSIRCASSRKKQLRAPLRLSTSSYSSSSTPRRLSPSTPAIVLNLATASVWRLWRLRPTSPATHSTSGGTRIG